MVGDAGISKHCDKGRLADLVTGDVSAITCIINCLILNCVELFNIDVYREYENKINWKVIFKSNFFSLSIEIKKITSEKKILNKYYIKSKSPIGKRVKLCLIFILYSYRETHNK